MTWQLEGVRSGGGDAGVVERCCRVTSLRQKQAWQERSTNDNLQEVPPQKQEGPKGGAGGVVKLVGGDRGMSCWRRDKERVAKRLRQAGDLLKGQRGRKTVAERLQLSEGKSRFLACSCTLNLKASGVGVGVECCCRNQPSCSH